MAAALGSSSNASLPQRLNSPTPSGMSSWSQVAARNPGNEGRTSPTHNGKRSLLSLGRFRKHKDKDFHAPSRLKDLPASVRSFNHPAARSDNSKSQIPPELGQWSREGSTAGSDVSLHGRSTPNPRQGTFNKLAFRKGRGRASEELEHFSDHSEKQYVFLGATRFLFSPNP